MPTSSCRKTHCPAALSHPTKLVRRQAGTDSPAQACPRLLPTGAQGTTLPTKPVLAVPRCVAGLAPGASMPRGQQEETGQSQKGPGGRAWSTTRPPGPTMAVSVALQAPSKDLVPSNRAPSVPLQGQGPPLVPQGRLCQPLTLKLRPHAGVMVGSVEKGLW